MAGDKGAHWSERGQGLVLAVLAMTVLLGLLAMAVDVGLYLHERRWLQNAADAAALAGAAELPDNPGLAVSKAQEWAAKNGIAPEEIETIQVQTTNLPNDTIYVKLNRDFNWVFARVLGFTESDVAASATAMIGSPTGMGGLRPWAVTDEVFQGLNSGDTAVLKYNAQNVFVGNFLPIRLDGPGANIYRETIKYGSDSWVCVVGYETPDCPSEVTTETGNMTGPTEQGVDWLEANTPDNCDTFEEVFSPDPDNPGQYVLNPQCNPFITPQPATLVAIVPVIDDLCNGSCGVTILRFGMFFIEGIECGGPGLGNECEVIGRYVESAVDISAVVGPYDPLGSVWFVRLIQ